MTKEISTTRFGKVSYQEDYLIRFRDGIIGFPDLKQYVLIESPQMPLVLWLQSTEDASVAFPLVEPEILGKGFSFHMNQADEYMISIKADSKLKTFLIMTIPQDVEQMTVNFRAPVIMNISESTGGQIILQDKSLSLRQAIYTEFQTAMNSMASFESSDNEEPQWMAHNWKEAALREVPMNL
jgi:flagellar assembly factor FliW